MREPRTVVSNTSASDARKSHTGTSFIDDARPHILCGTRFRWRFTGKTLRSRYAVPAFLAEKHIDDARPHVLGGTRFRWRFTDKPEARERFRLP